MSVRISGLLLLSVGLMSMALAAAPAAAQTEFCPSCSSPSACITCEGQEYRLVYQTVYEQRRMTAYRIEYQTAYEDRQETRYRPVWETATREVQYTVARPVVETSMREERYTVNRPVYETQMRDCSYDVVRQVQETAEREEHYTVNRLVTETAEREEHYIVNRPVVATTYRTQFHTVYQPVTTFRTDYVDQGFFVNQTVMERAWPYNKLTWQPASSGIDPATGAVVYRRAGLYWTPVEQGRYEVARVWQPNVVPRQVQQVAYVPQVVTEQVPMQVCSVHQEQVCRKVPYQVSRVVQEECVRRVPYTVCRPVVEHVQHQVPVQVCRMVCEQCVRKVPVETCKMVYEQHVDHVPYQVCRMVAYQATVRTEHCVEKHIPVTYTCTVPRTVCCRVPVDPCGQTVDESTVPTMSAPTPVNDPAGNQPQPHRATRPTTQPRST